MKKRQRLYFVLFVLASLGLATGLALYALQDNVAFFYTPQEIKKFQGEESPLVSTGRVFRLGGLVEKGSVRKRGKDLSIRFVVTDGTEKTTVEYKGLLPDLFREGQGVVAKGALDSRGIFVATELLAKHDEKYMPPELDKALKKQK